MGSVHSFTGDERDHCATAREAGATARTGPTTSTPTDVMLTPAACYPLYPTATGTLPPKEAAPSICGRSSSATSRRSIRPGCRSSGSASSCAWARRSRRWRTATTGSKRGEEMLRRRRPGRASRSSPTIRSSAAAASMMAATQKEQDLKYELVVPVATAEKPTADRVVQLPPRSLRPRLRHHDRRRQAGPHAPASASAWSGSRWRCSRPTASTRTAGRRA